MNNLLFNKELLKKTCWSNLHGCSKSIILSEFATDFNGFTVAIVNSIKQAYELHQEIRFFAPQLNIILFPEWETLPYDYFSPHQDIISARIKTLYQLSSTSKGLLILPISTLLTRVVPRQFLLSRTFIFKNGDTVSIEHFRHQLEHAGYRHVSQVMEHGEYAIRGSIIDVFPMASNEPFRLDLFDDELESIRLFDPETQLTTKKVDQIEVLPAREYPLDDDSVALFRSQFRQLFDADAKKSIIYQQITDKEGFAGVEYYLPLFFDQMESIFDYIDSAKQCFTLGDPEQFISEFYSQFEHRFEQFQHNRERPLLPPDQLLFSLDEIHAQTKSAISLYDQVVPDTSCIDLKTSSIESINSEKDNLIQYVTTENKSKILIVCESLGRLETLSARLRKNQTAFEKVDNWQDALKQEAPVQLATGMIFQGCVLPQANRVIVSEFYLSGQKPRQTRRKNKRTLDADSIIHNLSDLKPGDAIVHIDHGIGRYEGLTTLNINDMDNEFVTLRYQDNDKLYVPVTSLHLIARYSGSSQESAPISRLGSDKWAKAKKKAAQKVRDVAAELLEIYAKREAAQGYSVTIDSQNYQQFCDEFPFEETEDQLTAIHHIEQDMVKNKPMDRLVCGDVGFGKTEVAMRAAFLAIDGGKQAAVLVPTTLLAQQHLQNFIDRFANWPFRIEGITRFTTAKQVKQIEQDLENGKIDLIIGTHKLLSKKIKFHDLGLVIIDEEHRFGVRHKEHMKNMRASVDVLTLTATPIPRTLNMSLSGMRDLSIITTPPAERLAIKTLISEWNDDLIIEACHREIARGGQVYFLHNEVKTIERITHTVEKLLPNARVRYAHGQMHERELETTMVDFYHQKFNILVATTIIESGIDIPTANTIIINRADKLGLAQLHQIRGRVGRSHHRAYAYLLVPPKSVLTKDAVKRLDAIASMEDLGVGFTLATHDMEIRGAGELLGDEQSGQIQQIGFTLYSELLERAVKTLKEGKRFDADKAMEQGIEIELGIPAVIPSDYIYDVQTRLIFYKRIASAVDNNSLRELQVELIDRFGLLPDYLKNLISITELKIRLQGCGILKVSFNKSGGQLRFSDAPKINTEVLIGLIQKTPNIYRLEGQHILRCHAELEDDNKRLEFVQKLLDSLILTT